MFKKFFNKHHMLLSKYELEQVISEYDAMSMAFLKNPVDAVELMEYVKTSNDTVQPSHPDWILMMYVDDAVGHKNAIASLCATGAGRLILGTTSFQCFQELRRLVDNNLASRVDVMLFRHSSKVSPYLQFACLVQELEDLGAAKFIATMDPRTFFECFDPERMAKTIVQSDDGIVLPHHMIRISDNGISKKSNALHYEYNSEIYYVSSFDSAFAMDGENPSFYRVMSPVKFVQMNYVLACSIQAFKALEIMEYTFDPEGSLYYSALDKGKCVHMTSVMSFAMLDPSPVSSHKPTPTRVRG